MRPRKVFDATSSAGEIRRPTPAHWGDVPYFNGVTVCEGPVMKEYPFQVPVANVSLRKLTPSHRAYSGEDSYGAHAAKAIGAEKCIGWYGGALRPRIPGQPSSSSFIMECQCDKYELDFDANDIGNEIRYVNDYRGIAAAPNVYVGEPVHVEGAPGWVVANPIMTSRAIAAGEEYLLDYGDNYWRATLEDKFYSHHFFSVGDKVTVCDWNQTGFYNATIANIAEGMCEVTGNAQLEMEQRIRWPMTNVMHRFYVDCPDAEDVEVNSVYLVHASEYDANFLGVVLAYDAKADTVEFKMFSELDIVQTFPRSNLSCWFKDYYNGNDVEAFDPWSQSYTVGRIKEISLNDGWDFSMYVHGYKNARRFEAWQYRPKRAATPNATFRVHDRVDVFCDDRVWYHNGVILSVSAKCAKVRYETDGEAYTENVDFCNLRASWKDMPGEDSGEQHNDQLEVGSLVESVNYDTKYPDYWGLVMTLKIISYDAATHQYMTTWTAFADDEQEACAVPRSELYPVREDEYDAKARWNVGDKIHAFIADREVNGRCIDGTASEGVWVASTIISAKKNRYEVSIPVWEINQTGTTNVWVGARCIRAPFPNETRK